MNILSDILNNLKLLYYSTPIKASHLQELNYPDQELKKYASIINKQISYHQSHPTQRRYQKNPLGTPFTFIITNKIPYWLDIVIIFPRAIKNAQLGTGAGQQVKKSISLLVTFLPTKEISVQIERTALHRFNKGYDCKRVEKTNIMHKELLDKLATTAKIAEAPRAPRIYLNKHDVVRIEMDSTRYDTDLLNAIVDNKIDTPQSVRILSEIGDTLQTMHNAGFVHRDIKPENILMQGSYEAALNDFELTTKIGHHDRGIAETYIYWDECSHAGFILPNTDIYGLTVSAFNIITNSQNSHSSMQLLSDQNQAEALFRAMLPRCDAPAKTIPELLDLIKDQNELTLAKAKGKIISIMSREVKNSQDLFDYYQKNKNLCSDVKTFLEGAKTAIPTLSSAQSLAAELRQIYQLFVAKDTAS